MAKDDLFAISGTDIDEFRELIQWWRTFRREIDNSFVESGQAVPFLCLNRPDGWDLGACRRLIRDSAFPFVYDVHLVGYPTIAARSSFRIEWQNIDPNSDLFGEVLTGERVSVNASAEEMAESLPEDLPRMLVSGGRMRANDSDTDGIEYSTGRWFFATAEEPQWRPTIIDIASERLVGRTLRTHLRPSGTVSRFFSLASTDGPTPLHPGTMAVAWDIGGLLMMALHEPRIFQATLETPRVANYEWSLTPYSQRVTEGETASIRIACSASNVLDETDSQTTSIDLAWDYDTTDEDDFVQTHADAINAAISESSEWTFDGFRLSVTFAPGDVLKEISVELETRDEGTVEGTESASLVASNPLSTTGIADIALDTAIVTIRDANAIQWDVVGPATANAEDSGLYKLIATGVYKQGIFTSLTLSRTGSVSDAYTSDWRDALTAAVSGRDDVSYERASDTVLVIAQEDGPIDPIEFSVGFLSGAEGQWILTIADAGASPDLSVVINQDSVTTEVS